MLLPWVYLFFVPAISMRLLAEDRKIGTVEVLMTLPLRDWEVVLAKFFAAFIFLSVSLLLTFPLVIIAASLGAYALLHAAKPPPEKSVEAPRPISVHTAPVTREDIRLQVVTQGEVRARTEIDLVAQVGGRVIPIPFEDDGAILVYGLVQGRLQYLRLR